MKNRRGAFTLMELLIVVAIIAMLLSILVTTGGAVMKIARRASCASQLHALGSVFLAYAANHGTFAYACVTYNKSDYIDLVATDSDYYRTDLNNYAMYGPSFSTGFGPLTFERLVSADYYVCPEAAAQSPNWWHDTALDYGACPWWHCDGGNGNPDKGRDLYPDNTLAGQASYMIRPWIDWKTPAWAEAQGWRALLADVFFLPDVVLGQHGDGVNVFYFDGSVQYRTDEVLLDNGLYPSGPIRSWSSRNTDEIYRIWLVLDGK